MTERRNQGTKEPGNQGIVESRNQASPSNPQVSEFSNPVLENPASLWRTTWQRAALLTGVCLLPLLILGKWQIGAGVFAGSALLLGDIMALKAPIDMMVRQVAEAKRPWVFVLSLLRIVVLGTVLLALIKFRIAHVLGVFIGVTMPVVAMVSAAVLKPRATSHKPQATSHKLGN